MLLSSLWITHLALYLALIHREIRNVGASGSSLAGSTSLAGISDQVAAELVAQGIQCHPNYGNYMDEVAADCGVALAFIQDFARQYDRRRYEFGDEDVPRRFGLPTWNTPVIQPFIQGDCKVEVRMLPGSAHSPTDVATWHDLAINATKLMACLMYSVGGRSIAGEHKDIGVYLYGPNSKFNKYLQAVSVKKPDRNPAQMLKLGDGAYIMVSEVNPGELICGSGTVSPQVGKRRSGLLFGIDLAETLLMGFCEVDS